MNNEEIINLSGISDFQQQKNEFHLILLPKGCGLLNYFYL